MPSATSVQVLRVLHALDQCLIQRYQWMMRSVRALMLDQPLPTTDYLSMEAVMGLGEVGVSGVSLMRSIARRAEHIDRLWGEALAAATRPEGQDLNAAVDRFQEGCECFMVEAEGLRRQLWEEVSLRDSLTGAHRRILLEETLIQQRAQGSRVQLPCSVLLVDHDSFKPLNDQFGHGFGDFVLCETARIMRNTLRSTDVLFRYGGDEWLVLLPQTAVDQANAVAQGLMAAIEDHAFVTPAGSTLRIQVSVGAAQSRHDEPVSQWIARADAAMYRNKGRGKPADH